MPVVQMGEYQFDYQGSIGEEGSLKVIQYHGVLDPNISLFLKHMMRIYPSSFLFDVGANIGYFSIYASALSSGKARIIAIEPEESNCRRIAYNIKQNALEDMIDLHHAAAGIKKGKADFYFSSKTDHAHSFYDHSDAYNDDNIVKQKIDVITINQFQPKIPSSDTCIIMKIDTEGAEYDVLQGANKLLQHYNNVWIMCELHTYGLMKMGCNVDILRSYMLDYGFDSFAFQYDIKKQESYLPLWIPPNVKIKQNYVTDILFARKDNIHLLWQDKNIANYQ